MPGRRRENPDRRVGDQMGSIMTTTGDDLVGKVAAGLGHPLRVTFIDALRDGSARSPVEVADRRGRPLGTIGRHARVLEDLGVVVMVDTRAVRGAVEHVYSLEGPTAPAVIAALDMIRATEDRTSAESG